MISGAIRLRLAVGKGGEDEIDAVERGRLEPLDAQVRIGRARDGDGRRRARAPAWLSPNRRVGAQRGMAGAEPQQLRADKARGPKDRNVDHSVYPPNA